MSETIAVALIAAVPGILSGVAAAVVPSRRVLERLVRVETKVDMLLKDRD